MVSLVREWVLFILLFILSMGSRKAVLSVPRTLDMVPLGEILQGRSNQGVKAYSDNSDRYNSDSVSPIGKFRRANQLQLESGKTAQDTKRGETRLAEFRSANVREASLSS